MISRLGPAVVGATLMLSSCPATLGGTVASTAPSKRPQFLVAFDAESGKTGWRVSSGNRPGLLIVRHALGDRVYAEHVDCRTGDPTALVAFDADSGERRWQTSTGEVNFGVGKSAVVISRDGSLRGIDPASGSVRWRRKLESFDLAGGNRDSVLVSRSDSEGGVVRAIERRTGRIRWEYAFSGLGGSMLADDETVVLATGLRPSPGASATFKIHVFDANTGAPKIQFDVPYLPDWVDVTGSVVAVFTTATDEVNGYDAESGELLWTATGLPTNAAIGLEGRFVVQRDPDTTGPPYTVIDADTGAPLTPIRVGSLGEFDVDDQTFVTTDIKRIGEGFRSRVLAVALRTGAKLWQRTIDSYVSVAIFGETAYAAGGCVTAR